MSRSIHTTRRTLARIRKQDFSDKAAKAEAIDEGRQQIWKKRRIKRQVTNERKRKAAPLAGTAVETIPIEVLDESPYVHHAASPGDIRAILTALPEAATEGISRIQLLLGVEDMEESARDSYADRDPFTGRLSYTVFPGVYAGDWLGSYSPKTGRICIHAYVFDESRLPLPRPLCEVYLRLHALKTLVHEVAHHHDRIRRVSRGRWLSDREENFEAYAEKMEYEWTNEIVIPYLKRAYPKETKALRKWVAHRGGLMVPLEFFAGDCRKTQRNGFIRLVFSTSSGFESWVEEWSTCPSLTASRLAFAWELHYADLYNECLTVVENILAKEPNHVAALTCMADTLVHLERLNDASRYAERAVSLDPRNRDAWETQNDVFADRGDWQGALAHCNSWEALGKLPLKDRREIFIRRAIAYCALGNDTEMEKHLRLYVTLSRPPDDETANRRLYYAARRAHRRAGKPLPDSWKALRPRY